MDKTKINNGIYWISNGGGPKSRRSLDECHKKEPTYAAKFVIIQ